MSGVLSVHVDGIGVFGPGLDGWANGRAVLAGSQPYSAGALPPFDQSVLPATERRRSGKSVKLAVDLAAQATQAAGIDPAEPAIVFASTSGDTEVLTDICAALATEDRLISPMRFHNSVHNAASGYWTIAVGSRQPTNALSLNQFTAAAGLLEAATQAVVEDTAVLLVIYDIPFPPPLAAAEPIRAVFGTSLLLRPRRSERSLARMDLAIRRAPSAEPSTLADAELEALRSGVAAARTLPLLQLLAMGGDDSVVLEYLDGQQLNLAVTALRSPSEEVTA